MGLDLGNYTLTHQGCYRSLRSEVTAAPNSLATSLFPGLWRQRVLCFLPGPEISPKALL